MTDYYTAVTAASYPTENDSEAKACARLILLTCSDCIYFNIVSWFLCFFHGWVGQIVKCRLFFVCFETWNMIRILQRMFYFWKLSGCPVWICSVQLGMVSVRNRPACSIHGAEWRAASKCAVWWNHRHCRLSVVQRHTYVVSLSSLSTFSPSMLLCPPLHLHITAQTLQIHQLHHFISLSQHSMGDIPLLLLRTKSLNRVKAPDTFCQT